MGVYGRAGAWLTSLWLVLATISVAPTPSFAADDHPQYAGADHSLVQTSRPASRPGPALGAPALLPAKILLVRPDQPRETVARTELEAALASRTGSLGARAPPA